ncbi:MAG: Uma2 family endonuclease [Scytonema hyalinum WJT4-NPBG1]|jgi:Uma2 family endonuclease|nr:Uma2 family endonuclease [Scytonema hyalinum WJT4-NPBG1]
MSNLPLNIPANLKISEEQFVLLAAANRDVQLELTATGELIIMPPTGGNTGKRNIDIEGQLWFWNRQSKLGVAFNSSTAFRLPNGAERSPDAAWVTQARWDALKPEEQDSFPPMSPDFAIELPYITQVAGYLSSSASQSEINAIANANLAVAQSATVTQS